jgi:hypothetical protein
MMYTKGPWTDDGGIICGNGTIADVEGFVVAYADRSGDWPRFQRHVSGLEMRANATLISAAPELYEALEEALADIRCYYGTTYLNQHAKAEAALTKARGETK